MASTSTEDRLREILAQCMSDLIAEIGAKAERVPGMEPSLPEGQETAAFSGFGSTDLRGSFALI